MPEAVPTINVGPPLGGRIFLRQLVVIIRKIDIRQEGFGFLPSRLPRMAVDQELDFPDGEFHRQLKISNLPLFVYLAVSHGEGSFLFVYFVYGLDVFLREVVPILWVVGDRPGDFAMNIFCKDFYAARFIQRCFVGPFRLGIQGPERLFPNTGDFPDEMVVIIKGKAFIVNFFLSDFIPIGIMEIKPGIEKVFFKPYLQLEGMAKWWRYASGIVFDFQTDNIIGF